MTDDERKVLATSRRSVSRRDFIAQSGAVALGAAGMGVLTVPSSPAFAAGPPRRGGRAIAKRKEMYCEMQRVLHDEGGCIAPCFYDLIDAKRSRVQGMEPHPIGNMSGYQVCEQIWLAS